METLFGYPVIASEGAIDASVVIEFGRFDRLDVFAWPLNLSVTPQSIARLRRAVRRDDLRARGGQPAKARRCKRGGNRLL